MLVEVDLKITIQDGDEAGKVIHDKKIFETETEQTEFGTIERLRFDWNYLHNLLSVQPEKKGD